MYSFIQWASAHMFVMLILTLGKGWFTRWSIKRLEAFFDNFEDELCGHGDGYFYFHIARVIGSLLLTIALLVTFLLAALLPLEH